MSNLTSAYNPKETEDKIYKLWEDSGLFTPENLPGKRKKKFSTVIAPPNITGELHVGHALELTLQDIIVRTKRMQGYRTLWLPGTDHASIAVHVLLEKELAKEGLTRSKIGKEEFLKRAWAWREKYGNVILGQLKKLGLSLDWTRLRFTMDSDYQGAVKEAFNRYYKKGLIYRGIRVINWCTRCQTSISDLEVKYVPEKTKLYFIRYGPFTLATTRPETKLGDTALAVHPGDERYKKYIGKDLEIESVDNDTIPGSPAKLKKIRIKVVDDQAVDKGFGTGIVKVTPAHDITDYEIGQRHSLESVQVIDEYGRMDKNAGPRFEGLKISEAREKIIADLKTLGLMEKIEDYEHNIGRCDRCNSVIEPLPSKQWFLKMKELAQLALRAERKGKVRIIPERWSIPYKNWFESVRDWNISRQLWWGHKIPIEGEEDIFDTWFSSALWPMATLGWPDKKSKDFREYYPTDFITSDRGILFLWQARMVFSGMEFTGKSPFKDMLIHATVMTKDGKRMSKSLGTGINPLDLIEKYGTDALRFGLAYQTTDLQDMRFSEDVVKMGQKFANKLWNIARYVMLKNGPGGNFAVARPKNLKQTEITDKLHEVAKIVTQKINGYELGDAARLLYDFIWHEFADKYLEETKKSDNNSATLEQLGYVLTTCLKLLHPFMPFVTEEIWSLLNIRDKTALLVEKWPV